MPLACASRLHRTLAVYLAALSLFAGCSPGARRPRLVSAARDAMGSELRVTAWTARDAEAREAFQAVFSEFDRLDALLSVWKPDSDIVRLNAAAGREPVAIAGETREVLAAALEAHARTRGAFDVTFGRLAEVWKFDHDQDNRVPTEAEIRERLPFVDARAIVLDPGRNTAFISRKGVRVHLGGIGKGFAVDRAARILRDRGFSDFMIQAGGDLYVGGGRDGQPWRLGINDPRGPADESFATLKLTDATLSTSGDYERFFFADGVRYHHLIDTRTGQPARGCRSVSIVARTALQADWLSTGVFVLGPVEGMALVEALPDVEAVIVTAGNDVLVSSGLEGKVTIVRPPTNGR